MTLTITMNTGHCTPVPKAGNQTMLELLAGFTQRNA